mgnify:FL=1
MKKILGLDLGVGSVGWSVISCDDEHRPLEILGMGSRIVPLTPDESNEFSSGNAASKNQSRTQKRTARKGYDRYQLRRQALTVKLRELGMLPDEALIKLPVLDLWTLRARAATPGDKLSLPEIGRVLYHLNQKRGYRHSKQDDSADKTQRDYVQAVNKRFQEIKDEGLTIGQHFAEKLKESEIITDKGAFYNYRIKEQVFPRAAYVEEFDRIIQCQREFYPEVFTEAIVNEIRNEIIYYQRPLKSCKHLVSVCEFMQRELFDAEHNPIRNGKGEIVVAGPKCAPKSSPLAQVCKIWEEVNNIRITNKENDEYFISIDNKHEIFDFLNTHEKMKADDLFKILGLAKNSGWSADRAMSKGMVGNTTRVALMKALKGRRDIDEILRFDLREVESSQVNADTGEVLMEIGAECESEPLYRLWHIIYSISDKNEQKATLEKQFGITDESMLESLCRIDFVKQGYSSRSFKFMRKILPSLMDGAKYSEACDVIGVNHSDSITKAENQARELLTRLPQLQKNELRQPVVEKILNQMINVVNAVIDKYGAIDEIRVEMARELKLSKAGRESAAKNIRTREKANEEIAKRIEELGLVPSKNKILKYRLWEESGKRCFYCGQPVSATEFLNGLDVEIEHVVPKSLLFDDSFSNKVCACRKCNAEKGNATAFDFMKGRGENAFEDYLKRVETAFKENKISQTKRNRLLTPADKIPKDFIARQLVQTQYISRKAMEILNQVCRNVYGSSGDVTAYLRRIWGYDEILHSLDLPRYREGNLTGDVTYVHRGQTHTEERIRDWSKRLDHRHHAIDALTIACTRQSIIQRLNTLNAKTAIGEEQMSLEKWTLAQAHFSVADVADHVADILVSFKSGKRVTTPGKRYVYKAGRRRIVQENILVPRGALSEESVYGRIKSIEEKVPVKKLFERVDDIVKPRIRRLIRERLEACGGDCSKAVSSLKKSPLYLDDENTIMLEYGSCFKPEYVIKYSLNSIKAKDAVSIVDKHVREVVTERLASFGDDPKKAFAEPLYADKAGKIQIKTVRCYTGLSQVVPVKKDADGNDIGFVKPGNNHHIAIYKDADGKYQESIVTFCDAVERKKYGIPVVVRNPVEALDTIIDKNVPEDLAGGLPSPEWTFVMSMQQNEMFVLGMGDDEFNDALAGMDYKSLGKHLYRVQKLATSDYFFRSQYETKLDDTKNALSMKKYYRTRSFKALFALNPRKVSISLLGEISLKDD